MTWRSAHTAPARRHMKALCARFDVDVFEINGHWGFSKDGKRFGWLSVNHHGDERVLVTLKAPPGEAARLIASDPQRYRHGGHSGWVGIFVDVDDADWDGVDRVFEFAVAASKKKKA